MKKYYIIPLFFVFLSISTTAKIATYHGELEAKGPKAEFLIGFASDNSAELEIETPEKEGINISHIQNYSFKPSNESRLYEGSEESLSLKEFKIKVESVDPSKRIYEIPVSLMEHSNSNSEGGIAPRILQEREYTFEYHTKYSDTFEGDLIDSESQEDNSSLLTKEGNTEDSLTAENKSSSNEIQNQEDPRGQTTLILGAAIFLVFSYVFYEVFT